MHMCDALRNCLKSDSIIIIHFRDIFPHWVRVLTTQSRSPIELGCQLFVGQKPDLPLRPFLKCGWPAGEGVTAVKRLHKPL